MAIVTDENELEDWKKAGRIAAQARDYGAKLIVKGAKLIDVSDAIGLKEAVLNVFNSTGSLINTTTVVVGGLVATVGVVYNFVSDGVYSWFYRVFDLGVDHHILDSWFTLSYNSSLNVSITSY